MTGAGVLSLEAAEAADSITLGTLRKIATALDCELQYALVPKHGIAETLQKRAREVARERVLRVSHTMALEEQSVDSELTRTQIEELAETLLRKRTKELWR
jgi:predicted DNA-binding mobile mystery protein A